MSVLLEWSSFRHRHGLGYLTMLCRSFFLRPGASEHIARLLLHTPSWLSVKLVLDSTISLSFASARIAPPITPAHELSDLPHCPLHTKQAVVLPSTYPRPDGTLLWGHDSTVPLQHTLHEVLCLVENDIELTLSELSPLNTLIRYRTSPTEIKSSTLLSSLLHLTTSS